MKSGGEFMRLSLFGKPHQKKQLRDHLRSNMSSQKTPSIWAKVSEFPLTGSRKFKSLTLGENI